MLINRAAAASLDDTDDIAFVRDRFALPPGVLYLDGNSLGALPKSVPARLADVIEREWGQRLIRSWNEAGWWTASRRVADRLAPLLGASAEELAVADSTSVNLFKLLMIGARLRPDRRVIIAERAAFPTDVYLARSVADLLDGELRLIDEPAELDALLDEEVALVCLSQVDFRTGLMWDAAETTERVHAVGALMLWDLCHSAGAVEVDLTGWRADLAVGCGYKYLNGGPGAPAFCYVAAEHHALMQTPLPGWHGHAQPFAMSPDYQPAPGIGQLANGTPPMLSLLAFEEALGALADVRPAALRAKSVALTSLFIELIEERCPELVLVSPREANQRGSQVSLHHNQAYELVAALIERGVIGDFRAPDIARFGFAPAYQRFVDVWDAVEIISNTLTSGDYQHPRFSVRSTVT
ncbi:MAG TPA: kynureninase [Pseudonocardiaceae bacterium]|jgi:kynureninase|nr:kynureninase [Pseudonocardiaceae bacterium]